MGTHILVPLDGSPQSWAAFDHACSEYDGETITVLHVVDPMEGVYADSGGGYFDKEIHDRALETGEQLIEEAQQRGSSADVLESTVIDGTVETGRPARTIVEYITEHGVDHVVMGSHGRKGFSRLLLGSVAETVMRRSPVPVTIVR